MTKPKKTMLRPPTPGRGTAFAPNNPLSGGARKTGRRGGGGG